jgi:serine/threonine protein kinase
MGVVWEAWDERLERAVAVKQLHALPGVAEAEAKEAKDRAMREARITARLHHPHAVPVFDAVEHDGQPCLIMQLLPSTPLSTVIHDSGPLPLGRVATIGAEVASALTAAHALGIVHRDVKPGNILITPDGGAHISDFGISHAMGDAALTRTGMIHGTPAYLAPEVARGEDASFPADVFSLGSTLYAALEGSPPFGSDGNSLALLHKVAAANVSPPTRAGSLTPFLLEMLASEPDDRPSMEAVAVTLAALRTDDGAVEVHTTAPMAAVASSSPPEREPDLLDDLLPQEEVVRDEAPDPVRQPAAAPAPPRTSAPRPDPVPGPRPGPPQDVSEGERRRRLSPLLLVVAALVVAGLAWALVSALNDDDGRDPSQADSGATTQSTPKSPSPTPSATPATPTPSVTPTTASPSATPTPSPTTASSSPSATANSSARLSTAITTYYGLLPDDTDAAWPLLTAGYQRSPSGGREGYERFWAPVRDVAVSNVRATPPDRVTATITYSYDDGRKAVESTRYRLVDEDGVLKIAASEVLSSRRS